jgi:hypothetical protein
VTILQTPICPKLLIAAYLSPGYGGYPGGMTKQLAEELLVVKIAMVNDDPDAVA